jgi:hypothetical protein
MIGTGKKLSAFSPAKTKTGNTYFKVMDYDRNNPQAKRYATIFCDNDVALNDRDKVIITNIKGVSLGEYKGQQQTAIFASVVLDVEGSLNEMAGNVPLADDDNSLLPF